MKTLKNIQLSDFDLEEEFDDVGAALSALVSKGPGNATNGYTELKCC